jgi:hypothetical protein
MSQLSLLVGNPDAARKSRQLVIFASSLGTFTRERWHVSLWHIAAVRTHQQHDSNRG